MFGRFKGWKRPFGQGGWFWLGNVVLWLLLGWAQTEQVTVQVTREGNICRAWLPEERSSEIVCEGLTGGSVGVYQPGQPQLARLAQWVPLPQFWEWQAAWQQPSWQREAKAVQVTVPQWGAARRQTTLLPLDAVALTARLRRLDGEAGLLFVGENGRFGYLFLLSSNNRRGVWWLWQDGQPVQPLAGIPFQKPLLAQLQTLIRKLVGSSLGIWLLLPLAALLRRWQPHRRLPPLSSRWLLLPAIWLAFALTLLFASRVLERVPHVQDSITYLFQAQTLARGRLTAPPPPLPDFFTQEFLLVRQGKWFGKYPPGFPLLLALGVRLGVPWLINPLLAALALALLFQLGRQLYGRAVGVTTAVLALTSPFFLVLAGSYMAHMAEMFWLLLFMVVWLRSEKRPFPWLLLAGVALGMALLTRQFAALAVGIPFALLTLGRHTVWQQWRQTAVRLAGVGLLLATFGLLLLGYQWRVTGNAWLDPRLLFWPYDRIGFGDTVGEASNRILFDNSQQPPALIWFYDPEQPPRGHTLARGVYNVKRNWQALATMFLPLPGGLALVWLALLGKRPFWQTWLLAGTAVGGMAAYLFYWHPGIMYGPRYFYAILPTLLPLAAYGLWLASRQSRWAASLLLLLLLLATLVRAPTYLAAYQDFNFVDGQRLAQVQAALPQTPALLFVADETGGWWDYGTFFSANTPWLDGSLVVAHDRGFAANQQLRAAFPRHAAYLWRAGQLQPLP